MVPQFLKHIQGPKNRKKRGGPGPERGPCTPPPLGEGLWGDRQMIGSLPRTWRADACSRRGWGSGQLACRESTALYSERGIVLEFVLCSVHALLNTGRSISVWDFVKFSNHNSRTLNEIRLIKVWCEPLLAGYRQLFNQCSRWKRHYWYWITL